MEKLQRGFTFIELLIVIATSIILVGLIGTEVSSSLYSKNHQLKAEQNMRAHIPELYPMLREVRVSCSSVGYSDFRCTATGQYGENIYTVDAECRVHVFIPGRTGCVPIVAARH